MVKNHLAAIRPLIYAFAADGGNCLHILQRTIIAKEGRDRSLRSCGRDWKGNSLPVYLAAFVAVCQSMDPPVAVTCSPRCSG